MGTGSGAAHKDPSARHRSPAPVPVWAPGPQEQSSVALPLATDSESPLESARVPGRPRSGLVVALFAFYCLQFATAALAWREAPIRTDAQLNAIIAYGTCAALVVPAFVLRGRWRILPVVVAAAAGTAAPVLLTRDLMEVVGPREVWVGQSLTLQVLFPVVVGLATVMALATAPKRVPARWDHD